METTFYYLRYICSSNINSFINDIIFFHCTSAICSKSYSKISNDSVYCSDCKCYVCKLCDCSVFHLGIYIYIYNNNNNNIYHNNFLILRISRIILESRNRKRISYEIFKAKYQKKEKV